MGMTTPYRNLMPGQRCQVWVHSLETAKNECLFETRDLLLEAPNWSPSGDALILNGNGKLWNLSLKSPDLSAIDITGLPPLNNDHVIAPDGTAVFVSTYEDWHIYRASLTGGAAERVTDNKSNGNLRHFLHGISPDGLRLAFVGIRVDETSVPSRITFAEIFTIGSDGKDYRQITHDQVPSDGPEYSSDGNWIYFNTERFTGHAQIARMRPDGRDMTQLSSAETVDWFPHTSPNGKSWVYLSYPPGTLGHPADRNVSLKLVENENWSNPKTVAAFSGGQGTINVNSWSPQSDRFAYVAYPFD